jgi:hypothetical protein
VTNTALGYDWSSVQVDFRTITVQHADGTTGKQRPGIEIDFEFANQIFAAVGITAQHVVPAVVGNYTNPAIPNPVANRATGKLVTKEHRAAATDKQINVYYVNELNFGGGSFAGVTFQPNVSVDEVQPGVNDGILIARGAIREHADTFAHETVHCLLGSTFGAGDEQIFRHRNDFDEGIPNPDPNDPNPDAGPSLDQGAHAPNDFQGQNLMNRIPNVGGVWTEREPHTAADNYPKKSIENTAPSDPLLNPYTRGTFTNLRRDQLNGEVYLDANASLKWDGTETLVSQIEGIYESAYVKGSGVVHDDFAAVADLKWVEDNWQLENKYNADVGFRPDVKDGLEFRVPLPSTPGTEKGTEKVSGTFLEILGRPRASSVVSR